jgi:hypothetical protein
MTVIMRNLVFIAVLLSPGWAAAQTPEPDEEGCKDSKLLALLGQKLIRLGRTISPWGYPLSAESKR